MTLGCEALDGLLDLGYLRKLNFFFHGWSADTISIDNDLVWAFSLVFVTILLEGFQNKVLKNICSSGRGFLLLNFSGDIFVLVHVLVQILVLNVTITTGQLGVLCGAKTNDGLSSERNYIYSNNHRFCVVTANFIGNLKSVIFIPTLCVNLTQNV